MLLRAGGVLVAYPCLYGGANMGGFAVTRGGASLTPGYILEPFQGSQPALPLLGALGVLGGWLAFDVPSASSDQSTSPPTPSR